VLRENEYKDVQLTNRDVNFSACKSDGPGGQNVNKVSTAVRLTHKETGETVFCHDGRKQGNNRKKALKRLQRKLNKQAKKKHQLEENTNRKEQVGVGMRGDKIRTYNYRENRIKNHKTGKIVRDIKSVVEQGRIDKIQ